MLDFCPSILGQSVERVGFNHVIVGLIPTNGILASHIYQMCVSRRASMKRNVCFILNWYTHKDIVDFVLNWHTHKDILNKHIN